MPTLEAARGKSFLWNDSGVIASHLASLGEVDVDFLVLRPELPVRPPRNSKGKVSASSPGTGLFNSWYSTLPAKDFSRIDFVLTDSRGVPLDLEDSNLSFVITFSTDHLMM